MAVSDSAHRAESSIVPPPRNYDATRPPDRLPEYEPRVEYRTVTEWTSARGSSYGVTEHEARKDHVRTLAYDHAQKEGAICRVQRREVGAWEDVEVKRASEDARG